MTTLKTVTLTINEENQKRVRPLTEGEYNGLKESIKNNGQHVPIIINEQWVIIDGYHRNKICLELGIEPWYIIKSFKDRAEEIKCILDCNDKRRHLNNFERIALELNGKEFLEEIARKNSLDNLKQNQNQNQQQQQQESSEKCFSVGRVSEEIGRRAGVSYKTVEKVETILNEASEEDKDKARKGQISINKLYNQVQKQEKKQKSLALRLPRLPDNDVQIIHNTFQDACNTAIQASSVHLLVTDPPYDGNSLPLYKDLGVAAMRVLVDGGSLVTYVGEGYQDVAIQYLKESGLKFWNIIVVKLAGKHSDIHYRKTFQYCKTLLWFVKGGRLKDGIPISYIPNYVESTVPDKSLHEKGWEQSVTESEFIIKYLTLPNETVCDVMCGTGTTGVAALNLGRQCILVDKEESECRNADAKIRKFLADQRENSK